MLTVDDIAAWDAVTASRGRAYARSGRVVVLRSRRDVTDADVQGTDLYRVRVAPADDDYSCSCPVGETGALCKHVAAVLVVLEQDVPADEPAHTDGLEAWLDGLCADDLRNLLDQAATSYPEVSSFLERAYLAEVADIPRLTREIKDTLTPRRTFYEYGAAHRYADEALDLVGTIEDLADRPTPDLLRAVELALTLVVRAALRSDTSSGGHGMAADRLLDLHAAIAAGCSQELGAADARRLATWVFNFRFDGKQDFFDPEIDRYADALGEVGVAAYRTLLDGAERSGKDAWGVRHARQRLAVLDRDPEQIARAFGADHPPQLGALRVSEGLDEAGFTELAHEHARRGLDLQRSIHHAKLVDRVATAAEAAGDLSEVVRLRDEHLRTSPSEATFAALRSAALQAGTWSRLQAHAERHLRVHAPTALLVVLLGDQRDDEAWQLAMADPDAAAYHWPELCRRRAATHPEETLPRYRALVTDTLRTTGASQYAIAARQLVAMRDAARAADQPEVFREFMAEVAEANRRRPTCISRFVDAGLIARDRSVR